jgi:predicted DNA-binding WGR domain protein
MKQAYLENTIDNHDKFYHMMENKDGVSFTASWGKIGSDGRSYVYDMSEWDNKYQEKINKGYENISGVGSNVTPPPSWICSMTDVQRKKQGITTVMPSKMDKDGHEENSIHYDVGQVDVEVNHSHQNKLRILKMTMENWSHDGRLRIEKFLYEADLHKVKDLMESGREILTKDEMLDLNVLFKTYGGKRKVNE